MDEPKLLLIVEDMPGIRELLELTLRFKGYEVMSAQNGQEALEMVRKKRPALIVTDILMPRMDGFTLIYRLRKDQETRIFQWSSSPPPMCRRKTRRLPPPWVPPDSLKSPSTWPISCSSNHRIARAAALSYRRLRHSRKRNSSKKYQITAGVEIRAEKRTDRRAEQLASDRDLPTRNPALRQSLKQALNERQSIEAELEHVRQIRQRGNPQQ